MYVERVFFMQSLLEKMEFCKFFIWDKIQNRILETPKYHCLYVK